MIFFTSYIHDFKLCTSESESEDDKDASDDGFHPITSLQKRGVLEVFIDPAKLIKS